MIGLKLFKELKNQYIYSKTFDKSYCFIDIYINCEMRNTYGFKGDIIICTECICEFMCKKLKNLLY